MTPKEYAWAAVDLVIDLAAENGIKYRRGDFQIIGEAEYRNNLNHVNYIGDKNKPTGITVILSFDFVRAAKKLKSCKDSFYSYVYCRVRENGVYFNFSLTELDIQSVKEEKADESKIEDVIRKVQKLLALSDTDRNPSEAEAIAASMQVQKLLAKYNLEIADVTGEEKREEIEQVIADVGTGKKWKYTLANVVAESYCCKCYYKGSEMIIFYGYKSDSLIARRVFMYLFKVGNSLAAKYVKARKENGEWSMAGVYNSFCRGFCSGVQAELQKNCTALVLVTPQEVIESFDKFSESFKKTDHSIEMTDWDAYDTGKIEGKRALNAQYIEGETAYGS